MNKVFRERLDREGILRIGRNTFFSGGMKITLFLKDGQSRNGRNTQRYLNKLLKKRSWKKTEAGEETIRYLTNLAKFEKEYGVKVKYNLHTDILKIELLEKRR